MKIGILCTNLNDLRNWELRIMEELLSNPAYSISVIIKDGRDKGSSGKFSRLLRSNNIIGKILIKCQALFEEKLFPEKICVDKMAILRQLAVIDSISLYPEKKGFLDIFSREDADKIKSYDLDIILRHDFNIIRGDILSASKHGIWSFHHADNSINRGGPVGFWEIVLNEPYIGVTLQQLTQELDGGLVIDKGYFNRHWSFVKSRNLVYENSVTLLLKNLRLLHEYNEVIYSQSSVYYNKLYKAPTLKWMIRYWIFFYGKIARKLMNKLAIVFGIRPECWAIFSYKGNILNAVLFRAHMFSPGKNEFWADPFILQENNKKYLFFENYDYKKDRGKISCAIMENNKITHLQDVLTLPYHLSYPFITKIDNDIFLIPETAQNNRLEIYRAISFPSEWELYATAFEEESIADATYYKDSKGDSWLFVNKCAKPLENQFFCLYIYKIDSLKLNKLIPHNKNPVLIDCRTGRNGGSFFQFNGKIIRPSQNNTYGIYGYGLNLSEIKKLSLEEYEEELIVTIKPNFKKGLIASHHLSQMEDGFVIDGCFRYL
jgi:hypothetical protein